VENDAQNIGDIAHNDSRDEIGDLWTVFAIFSETSATMNRLQTEQESAKLLVEQSRKEHTSEIASKLESVVNANLGQLQTRAADIIYIAGNIGQNGSAQPSDALGVAEASKQAHENLQAVASAIVEMTASSDGISEQVKRATNIATEAAQQARKSSHLVQMLAEASDKVGSITKLISDIASQTHLLALNATIEAARAGDAGKGFAVVAGEVKRLADQTAIATAEIADQIGAIQKASTGVVDAINEIANTVSIMDEVAGSIADTVGQQGLAIHEISGSLNQVSANANTVSEGVAGVSLASAANFASAIQVIWAAEEMAIPARALSSEVDEFLSTLKA
jgi:methyl-accepting chemotaxis protein